MGTERTGHVYAGNPDARLAPEVPVSRFRPTYRQLSDAEIALHNEIKDRAEQLAQLIERIKPGRYRSLALTELEASVMWAVKELTGSGLAE